MGWDVGLAGMFKERNPRSLIGPCVGKVVSVNPLKVSILSGDVVLDSSQLYISKSLLEKRFKIELKSDDGIGDIAITSKPSNQLISININEKDKTELILYFELKKNDEVLIIPAEGEQVFFVVDIVEKVGD